MGEKVDKPPKSWPDVFAGMTSRLSPKGVFALLFTIVVVAGAAWAARGYFQAKYSDDAPAKAQAEQENPQARIDVGSDGGFSVEQRLAPGAPVPSVEVETTTTDGRRLRFTKGGRPP